MEGFIHDAYTLKALKQVRLGRSFFITGKAGTGKTTLLCVVMGTGTWVIAVIIPKYLSQ